MDDTFVLFKDKSHAESFLNFINGFHPNIEFSMDVEENNQLPFLDISVSRHNGEFMTGIFRKSTFTGLGLNFFSYCPFNFKMNSCKTLLHRAYSISSNWSKFHDEIVILTRYFQNNCYPTNIFPSAVKKFLFNIFNPKLPSYDVPKKLVFVSLPYMGNFSSSVRKELTSCLSNLYPYVKFNFIFKNPMSIGSLFSFKDALPDLMRSCIVYKFSCPKCDFGKYVGCTYRMIRVRIDSHKGVSHRTGCTLNKKEISAIRTHCQKCKHDIQYRDFKILAQAQNRHSLLFLESLFIKQLNPNLNSCTTSIPLKIA